MDANKVWWMDDVNDLRLRALLSATFFNLGVIYTCSSLAGKFALCRQENFVTVRTVVVLYIHMMMLFGKILYLTAK